MPVPSTTADSSQHFAEDGFRFADLKRMRLVTDRTDLKRKQEKHGFPYPIKLSERQAWWPRHEVEAWIAERAQSRNPPASPSPPPKPYSGKPRGRPRKPVQSASEALPRN